MRRRLLTAVAATAVLGLAAPGLGRAATIRVINRDGAGEGFNDSTAAAPVGGNHGTTIGAQRLIAFQYAADRWGERLASSVEIRVGANFDPLPCDSNSVTLGQAGPVDMFRDFAGAPRANTLYAAALADALAGVDMAPTHDDIDANFNSDFGTTCAFQGGWYYGLDGASSDDDSDFVTVVLHELAHGLGFITLVDVDSGARFNGFDDAFMQFLVDTGTGKTFDEMTNVERRAATTATGDLRWNGPQVAAVSGALSSGVDAFGQVEIYAPPFAQQGSSLSHWSTAVDPYQLLAPFLMGPLHDVGLAEPALLDLGWTAQPAIACAADCDGDGVVSIADLVIAVRIGLGEVGIAACPAADPTGDGNVGIDELMAAVSAALDGCPTA
ncbi:MAG: hypothetical protein ABI629_10555 [bacterium]